MKRKIILISFISLFSFSCSNISPEDAYQKGSELAKAGNNKKAYKLFKTAIKKNPENASYHLAAGTTAPDQNAAFLHFKNSWEKGIKTKMLLSTLLKLSFHVNKEEKVAYGLSLFDQLPESQKTNSFKGELFFQFAMYDSAISTLQKEQQQTPSADICNLISLSYTNKKNIDSALITLLNCKQNGLTNSNTFIQLASLLSIKFDYPAIEKLFEEVENSVYYTSLLKLEHAAFLIIHDKFDQAAAILELARKTASDAQRDIIENRIRTMNAYVAFMKSQSNHIDTLQLSITSSTPNGTNEIELLKAIKSVILNDSLALKSIEAARTKNPYNPFVDIICARKNSIQKNYDQALKYYTSLPGILQFSPRIFTETAITLVNAGKEDEAISRISLLHKHGIYTKQSLELFRDIAFKKNLLEKSASAQKLLEKSYGSDLNIKWHGLLLALKEGKIESAETIINELLQKSPNEERFIIAKFSILFLKKDYNRIINDLPESGLPLEKMKPLEAMAWLKYGDTSKAIIALEERLKKGNDFQIMTELAELYLNSNNHQKAADIYKKIIDQTNSKSVDSLKTASVLNNYAWVLSISESGNLNAALGAAKKAYDLASNNIHILDTYASILLKSNKYKECIKLLDNNNTAITQGRLLCHLADAYEKIGNLNKARRYYEDAIKAESSDQLPLTMSKEIIKERIKELLLNDS